MKKIKSFLTKQITISLWLALLIAIALILNTATIAVSLR